MPLAAVSGKLSRLMPSRPPEQHATEPEGWSSYLPLYELLAAFMLLAGGLYLYLGGLQEYRSLPGLQIGIKGFGGGLGLLAGLAQILRFSVVGERVHLYSGLALWLFGLAQVLMAATLFGNAQGSFGFQPGELRRFLPLVEQLAGLIGCGCVAIAPVAGDYSGRSRRPGAEAFWISLGSSLAMVGVYGALMHFGVPDLIIETQTLSRPLDLLVVGVALSALASFYGRWRHERSPLNWFVSCAMVPIAAGHLLLAHADRIEGQWYDAGILLLALAMLLPLFGTFLFHIRTLRERQEAIEDLQRSVQQSEGQVAKIRRYADDLERSQEDIESYTYAASHDLQEPLRSVQFFCSMLKERYRERLDDRGRQYLDFAVDGAGRMGELINAILNYSRVQRQGLHFRRITVGECLDRAVANLEQTVREKNLQISRGDLPTVTADRTHLTSLLQNLLANAMKYNDNQAPQVHVGAERRGEAWVIAVSDNGIGIDPRYHERIFTVFKRLHKREEYAGTGVGLSICQRIVHRRGGRIWVESRTGEGATFKFTIPDQVPADGRADESDSQ